MHRIFDDYIRKDISMRQITRGLNRDGIRAPAERAVWGVSSIGRILRNEAYIGRITTIGPNLCRSAGTRADPAGPPPARSMDRHRGPAILDEALFETARRISRDNARWNLRRAEPRH